MKESDIPAPVLEQESGKPSSIGDLLKDVPTMLDEKKETNPYMAGDCPCPCPSITSAVLYVGFSPIF
jgi:hypothetical protein